MNYSVQLRVLNIQLFVSTTSYTGRFSFIPIYYHMPNAIELGVGVAYKFGRPVYNYSVSDFYVGELPPNV